MVITDLVSEQYQDRPEEFEKAKQIFNLLGDRVENVARIWSMKSWQTTRTAQ